MNNDIRELYQELIMDHNQNPHNHHMMPHATHQAQGYNPLCGDKLTVYLHIEDDIVKEISFLGKGCAISQASGSLMTDIMIGKTVAEAEQLFIEFHHMMTQEGKKDYQQLDKLTILSGVKAFPARVKCATLAWHTLDAALHQDMHLISTE